MPELFIGYPIHGKALDYLDADCDPIAAGVDHRKLLPAIGKALARTQDRHDCVTFADGVVGDFEIKMDKFGVKRREIGIIAGVKPHPSLHAEAGTELIE